jgi:hypothetical protein
MGVGAMVMPLSGSVTAKIVVMVVPMSGRRNHGFRNATLLADLSPLRHLVVILVASPLGMSSEPPY